MNLLDYFNSVNKVFWITAIKVLVSDSVRASSTAWLKFWSKSEPRINLEIEQSKQGFPNGFPKNFGRSNLLSLDPMNKTFAKASLCYYTFMFIFLGVAATRELIQFFFSDANELY